MFILQLIFAAAEVSFLIYLIKKGKTITEEMRKLELEKRSVMNLKKMLEEDFIPEIEERKERILKEFGDKLYSYHLSCEEFSNIN